MTPTPRSTVPAHTTDPIAGEPPTPDQRPRLTIGLRLAFDVVVLILMVLAMIEGDGFRGLARAMPFYIGAVGSAVALLNLSLDVIRWRRSGTIIGGQELATAILREDDRGASPTLRRAGMAACWYAGFILLVWLIGARIAAVVFIIAFGRHVAEMSRRGAVFAGLSAGGAMWAFGTVMSLEWPAAVIDLWSM